jgi:hypothetical protein
MGQKNKVKKGIVTKTIQQPEQNPQLIVQELRILAPDRSKKDIGDMHNALVSAESVYSPQRAQLFHLYDRIMLDGHLTGIVGKRFDAVLNKAIYYEDSEGKRDERFDDLIESLEFQECVTKILETKLYGTSGMEFIPGEKFCFKEIPRRHIKPELGIIALDQYGQTGYEYADVSNVWVLGKERDLGLLLKCIAYVIWKQGNFGDWAQYIEIYGQPVRIIKYDAWDNKTKMELRQVLDESGSSLALMIPKQADFEMKDGKQSNGDGKLQGSFREACNEELSIVILGNTETTSSSKSSGYAQAKEHGKQQLEITKSDMKYVKAMLNSDKFKAILKSYGFPVDGGKFKFEKELDLSALSQKLIIDQAVSAKVPVADDYWYNTYGIPKPDNYNELRAKMDAAYKTAVPAQVVKPGNNQEEDDEEEPPANKPAPKSTKKGLKSTPGSWFKLRSLLADFFDQARLK